MKNKFKAFTLIELLVVVAIIGILASVVIVNLNSARAKGQDSAIKEQMFQLRTTSLLYYDDEYGYSKNGQTYTGGTGNCLSGTAAASTFSNTFIAGSDVVRAITSIQNNSGQPMKCTMGASEGTLGAQTWVITSKLRADTKYWCVDSSGNSRAVVNATPINTTVSGVVQYSCNQ